MTEDRELIAEARCVAGELGPRGTGKWTLQGAADMINRLATALEAAQAPEGWEACAWNKDPFTVQRVDQNGWVARNNNGRTMQDTWGGPKSFPTAQAAIAAVEAGE